MSLLDYYWLDSVHQPVIVTSKGHGNVVPLVKHIIPYLTDVDSSFYMITGLGTSVLDSGHRAQPTLYYMIYFGVKSFRTAVLNHCTLLM